MSIVETIIDWRVAMYILQKKICFYQTPITRPEEISLYVEIPNSRRWNEEKESLPGLYANYFLSLVLLCFVLVQFDIFEVGARIRILWMCWFVGVFIQCFILISFFSKSKKVKQIIDVCRNQGCPEQWITEDEENIRLWGTLLIRGKPFKEKRIIIERLLLLGRQSWDREIVITLHLDPLPIQTGK